MMKNSIIHSIVLALAISSFATVTPKDTPSAWQKTKIFLKKHKSKIAAGITAAAIIGLTIGLAYHGNRTMKAIEDARITPSDKIFIKAVEYVGLLGPLGEKNTRNILLELYNSGSIKLKDLWWIATSKIGTALCEYWRVEQAEFAGNLGFQWSGVVVEETIEGLENLFNLIKSKIKRKTK